MKLTKDSNNYRIIMRDGKVEYVNKEQYFQIVTESGNPNAKKFLLSGSVYSFSDVRRMEEPKDSEYKNFSAVEAHLKDKPPEYRLNAIKNMAIGLKKYIKSDNFCGTKTPKRLLQQMREKYIECKKDDEEEALQRPTKALAKGSG